MANIKSAIKRARKTQVLRQANAAARSRVRSFLKKANAAIASGDKDASLQAVRSAQSEMDKAQDKGLFKKNKAARDISRLNAQLKALSS